MGQIVWFIIVLSWILVAVKKKKRVEEQRGNSTTSRTPVTPPSTPVSRPAVTSDRTVKPQRQATVPNVSNTAQMPSHMEARMQSQAERIQAEKPKMQRSGNNIIASRLMEGDSVPVGYRKSVCSYCGAENLIPGRQPGNYICYFCHTEL